jgi:hypothetical protein
VHRPIEARGLFEDAALRHLTALEPQQASGPQRYTDHVTEHGRIPVPTNRCAGRIAGEQAFGEPLVAGAEELGASEAQLEEPVRDWIAERDVRCLEVVADP